MFRFLDGDINAINAYRGEYMNQYSWASISEAYMTHIAEQTAGAEE